MDKRKIIILAVLLFLFIGLGTFVFANPTQQTLEGNGEGDGNGDILEPTATPEETPEVTPTPTPIPVQDDETITTGTGNNTTGGTVVNTIYAQALEAVNRAEASLQQGDVNTAQGLVDQLEQGTAKDELQDRIDQVVNTIDVSALVQELQQMVENAEAKDDMDEARDFRSKEEVVTKVEALTNESVKTALQQTLNELAKVLDDTTAPVISGIDGTLTNQNVSLTIEDENPVTIYLNNVEVTADAIQNMQEGTYTVRVVDAAKNVATVTFTIEQTAPEVTNVVIQENPDGNDYVKAGDKVWIYVTTSEKLQGVPTLVIGNEELTTTVQYENGDNWNEPWEKYVYEYTVKEDTPNGELQVEVKNLVDLAGNVTETADLTDKVTRNVIVDTATTEINEVRIQDNTNGDGYVKVGDRVWVYVTFNEKLSEKPVVKIQDKELTLKYTENGDNWNESWEKYVYEYIVDKTTPNGEVSVSVNHVVDLAGNLVETADLTDKVTRNVIVDTATTEINEVRIQDNTNGDGYVKAGDKVWIYVNTTELLANDPVVSVYGEELTTIAGQQESGDGWAKYVYEYIVKEDTPNGELQIEVKNLVDLAGNAVETADLTDKVTRNVIVDTATTEINEVRIQDNTNGDGYVKVGDRVWVYVTFNEKLSEKPVVKIQDKELTLKYTENGDNWNESWEKYVYEYIVDKTTPNGEVSVSVNHVVDLAGNVVEIADTTGKVTRNVIVDTQNATVTNVRVQDKPDLNGYAKTNDVVWIYVNFSEKLKEAPIVEAYGEELKKVQEQLTDTTTQYVYEYVVKDTTPEGEITFTVKNVEDLAGNVVAVAENPAEFERKVVVDHTRAAINEVIIQDNTNGDGIVKAGDRVWLYITFSEKLQEVPTVTVNGEELTKVQELSGDQWNQPWIQYVYEYIVKEDAPQGEITFTVENVIDLAGNVAETIDATDKVTSNVIVDTKNAEINEVRIQDNTNGDGIVKTGDRVWVYVTFNEKLSEKPVVKIQDKELTLKYTENGDQWNQPWERYVYEYIVDETTPNGEVNITVNNVVDLAGNVAETVDTTGKVTRNVNVDTQNATVTNVRVQDLTDKNGYVKAGDKVWIYVNFSEKLSVVPTVEAYGETLKKVQDQLTDTTTQYVYEYIVKGTEENGAFQFTVKNVVDLAGNVVEIADTTGTIEIQTIIDTVNPVATLNGSHVALEEGMEYTDLGVTVTDNIDETRTVMPSYYFYYSEDGINRGRFDAIDTSKIGKYRPVYEVVDTAGNVAEEVTRWIFIRAKVDLEVTKVEEVLADGSIQVTLTANEKIQPIEGWTLSDDQMTLTKVYTENTDYLGEDVVVFDEYNNDSQEINVKVSSFQEEGKEVVVLTTKESFNAFVQDINNGTSFDNKVIKLTSDMDLSGEEWTPIFAKGNMDNTVIDGGNHTISNMETSRDAYKANGTLATPYGNGFISDNTSNNLTIKNLHFENVVISDPVGGTTAEYTQHYVGTVIGHNQGTLTIENVTVDGANLKSSWQTGGLVGYSSQPITFKNCAVNDLFIGGYNATAGTLFGLGVTDITVIDCQVTNARLYTDGLTWASTQREEGNFWVGHLYGRTLTVTNSTEENVTVVSDYE